MNWVGECRVNRSFTCSPKCIKSLDKTWDENKINTFESFINDWYCCWIIWKNTEVLIKLYYKNLYMPKKINVPTQLSRNSWTSHLFEKVCLHETFGSSTIGSKLHVNCHRHLKEWILRDKTQLLMRIYWDWFDAWCAVQRIISLKTRQLI